MKTKDNKKALIAVIIITAITSMIFTSIIFNSPKKHNLKAPVVESIPSSFPDIKNDPNYNSFLNNNALDVTQPVQVGNTQNTAPFNQ